MDAAEPADLPELHQSLAEIAAWLTLHPAADALDLAQALQLGTSAAEAAHTQLRPWLDSATVGSDWQRFQDLAARGHAQLADGAQDAAITTFQHALVLVRGRALTSDSAVRNATGAPEASDTYPWAPHLRQHMTETVVGTAHTAAVTAIALGRHATAEAILQRGLVAAPDDQRLLRDLLLSAEDTGDRRHQTQMADLVGRLLAEQNAQPAPETTAMINRLRDQPEPASPPPPTAPSAPVTSPAAPAAPPRHVQEAPASFACPAPVPKPPPLAHTAGQAPQNPRATPAPTPQQPEPKPANATPIPADRPPVTPEPPAAPSKPPVVHPELTAEELLTRKPTKGPNAPSRWRPGHRVWVGAACGVGLVALAALGSSLTGQDPEQTAKPPRRTAAASPSAAQPTATAPTLAVPPPAVNDKPERIDSESTDKRALTEEEIFPNPRAGMASRGFVRDKVQAGSECRWAARGDLANALGNCRQVVRATWVDDQRQIAMTIGVAALPTEQEATSIANTGDPNDRTNWWRGMRGRSAEAVDEAAGVPVVTTRGRYVIYAWVTHYNGQPPTAGDPALTEAGKDGIAYAQRAIDKRAK